MVTCLSAVKYRIIKISINKNLFVFSFIKLLANHSFLTAVVVKMSLSLFCHLSLEQVKHLSA